MNQKGFSPVALLALLALLGLIGGFYYFSRVNNQPIRSQIAPSPTITPTSTQVENPIPNKKAITYTNSKYNFSIDYPNYFQIISEEPRGPYSDPTTDKFVSDYTINWSDSNKEVSAQGNATSSFLIEIKEKPINMKGEMIIEKNFSSLRIAGDSAYQITRLTLNNNPVTRTNNIDPKNPSLEYLVLHKGILFRLYGYSTDPTRTNIQDFESIFKTLRFMDASSSNNNLQTGKYIINESSAGDGQVIAIKDESGKIISENIITQNEKEIGYNTKIKCQCGTNFDGWVDNSHFTIKISNGAGEEYEYIVDASTGKIDEASFKKIK